LNTNRGDDDRVEHGGARPGTLKPCLLVYVFGLRSRPSSPSSPRPARPVAGVPTPIEPLLHPDGPRPAFALREGLYLAADELKAALDQKARVVLVDARPMSDWIASHIPGAVPIPYYDVNALAEMLPKDGTMIVAYCACPQAASGEVVDYLRTLGFPATAILDEGYLVWVERGYPVVPGVPPEAPR
jgi:rhodanese-related sulfurtransferase